MKIPLEQALEYGIGLRDVADCYADRCAYTLATELTVMRLRAEKAEAEVARLTAENRAIQSKEAKRLDELQTTQAVQSKLKQEVARLQEALEKIQTLGLYPEDMLDICNQTLAKEQKPAGLPDTPGAALALIRSGYIKKIQEENAVLRAALEDIATFAHCTAKAGPLHTPDLAAAWAKFMQINVKASAALALCRKSP